MTAAAKRLQHRLDGLEPGNLLAFLALLGLLRALEEATPAWLPRVAWSVAELPLRPVLSLSEAVGRDAIVAAAATGIQRLAARHAFGTFKDLKLPLEIATKKLHQAAGSDSYTADLWAALASDAAVRERNKVLEVEPTPLCLMFGQGYQHFLERLQAVPRQRQPDRGPKRNQPTISETDCLSEALFSPWTRPDATPSFRWDSHEDVRYAHRATDPTDPKTKATTQHGANRLAAVGLAALTAVPRRRAGEVRLDVLGGGRDPDGTFIFTWPIWREPISLAALRTLLGHPGLDQPATRAALGIAELRRARRSSFGRYMNFTPAVAVERRHSPKPETIPIVAPRRPSARAMGSGGTFWATNSAREGPPAALCGRNLRRPRASLPPLPSAAKPAAFLWRADPSLRPRPARRLALALTRAAALVPAQIRRPPLPEHDHRHLAPCSRRGAPPRWCSASGGRLPSFNEAQRCAAGRRPAGITPQ